MKTFLKPLAVAGLAVLLAGAARAELFTIQRTVLPTSITQATDGTGNMIVDFSSTNPAPTPPQDPFGAGTSITLLNYKVLTDPNTPTTGTATFNSTFNLDVTFTSDQAGNPTHTSSFTGTVTGTASPTQDNVLISLTPVGPSDTSFKIGDVDYSIGTIKASDPPGINDVVPGAISARVNAIPEPNTMALFGVGVLPLLGLARRRK